jgi:hypothetical protein
VLRAWRILLILAVAVSASAPAARAALKIASTASGATLAVSADGRAQITWTQGGVRRTAVVTGSSLRYNARIANTSRAVHVAPTVPFALTQLQLPNGQQFALQLVQRLGAGPLELYLARWSGDATALTITQDAAGRICGTVTYHGTAVYGSAHTSAGNPLDALGRNVYLDTLVASGWHRMLGVLSRPLGWAYLVPKGSVGTSYRGLVIGPNDGGDLAPVASAETPAGTTGTCPFAPGTYKGA